jgi:post-segregation antitoxin (ccd killing protein)
MTAKVSTCVDLDREALRTARSGGLNISRVTENALAEKL